MTNTPSSYPTTTDSFTVKQNHIDVYQDDHINKLQNSVVALQTYIGTNPHGSKTNLTERLAVSLGSSGSIRLGSTFPASPVDGQAFWNSSEPAFYVYSTLTGTWASSQNLSNVVFEYTGVVDTGGGAEVIATTQNAGASQSTCYRYLYKTGAGFGTVFYSKFKKVAGMTTITVWARLWNLGVNGSVFRCTIGTVNGTILTVVGAPAWVSVGIGISGLTNGTTYDVVGELNASASNPAYCGNIIGIVS
jgi:hypothetical protein